MVCYNQTLGECRRPRLLLTRTLITDRLGPVIDMAVRKLFVIIIEYSAWHPSHIPESLDFIYFFSATIPQLGISQEITGTCGTSNPDICVILPESEINFRDRHLILASTQLLGVHISLGSTGFVFYLHWFGTSELTAGVLWYSKLYRKASRTMHHYAGFEWRHTKPSIFGWV